ncbi:MAG: tyrosine-type recombinase/integrase [Thermodesulfobacteriota bacterium]|nr:MAG: tyrosine-type recombinase/integrase [Thermodesulfobacteriota bacterium]
MGIYKKGTNWYIDYYLKGRRKRKKVGPSRKLAEQVLMDVQVKIAKKEYLGVLEEKKILFEEYVREYLEYSKANKSVATYERSDRFSTNSLKATFQGKYLFEITPQLIEKYKAMRLEKVEPATVNRELACLKHMYTKAMEWGYARINPAKGVKLLKEPPGRLRYLKPEEIKTLLQACSEHIRPIVVTALNTGMRRSEVLTLKWSHVDLENRKVTVVNTKNNESRVIPINRTLYQELLILAQKSNKGAHVFSGRDGNPFKDVKKSFSSALKKAGIEDFRFHDLRHTFGSHLAMKGVNPRTIQQVMGHKEIKMTMRYSHLSPEFVQEAVEKLDNLLDTNWTPRRFEGKEDYC